jgi:hypothetical protein
MNCCQCQGIELEFGRDEARQDLAAYHNHGPADTTQMLIDALRAEGVDGLTLLDVGGGIGTIQYELLKAGVRRAVSVEASTAYIEAAREEAERQDFADRITFHHGDFVDLAPDLATADIVTLDRVICCYHDFRALVGLSAARAGKLYGVVYPRDTWWMKLAEPFLNLRPRIQRNPFRTFAHPTAAVDALIRSNGLTRRLFYHTTFVWQVVVYAR